MKPLKKDSSTESVEKSGTKAITGEVAVAALSDAAKGLLFPSETDAPIEPFFWPTEAVEEQTVEIVAAHLKVEVSAIKTQSLTAFFKPVVAEEDWHNAEEKAQVKRFQELRDTVKSNVKDAKVFRVGKTEIEAYVVGSVSDGYAGFKTKVVET